MGSAYFDAHSLWQQSEKPLFTALAQNIKVDTCVIGAGIAGLTTAYLLAKEGQSVAVLDRERLGLGETGLTSAHLSNALDDHFSELQRLHGHLGARLAAESHTAAIDLIETIANNENIECEFKRIDGYLFLHPSTDLQFLMRELNACHESGMTDVTLLPRSPSKLFDSGPCLHFPRQGQFHPIKYIDGLAYALQNMGVKILTHSEVVEVKGGKHAYVKTSQGFKVDCNDIVVATNVPINNKVAIHTKNAAYRSYLVGVPVPAGKMQDLLLWDTGDPYHYIRYVKDPHTDEDILLVGGEDHRTGQDVNPEHHFENLRKWIEDHFDIHARVITRWSGQIMEPVDGLAYIGHNPGDEENVYIITGDSGHGLTHGTLGAMLLRDLILGRNNPWAELYNPSRLHFRSLGTYVREATQSTVPYGDWLSDGDVDSASQVEAGEGAVLREGLRKVAVYKDEMNRVHCFSAVCTHLGGIVRWNSAEKTWDCPCHGSRFDRFGQVINGPAVKELAPVSDPSEATVETIPPLSL
jgi:glycine/D-amino acid oxidase-like deaminating enzyme/nitrite reductase/ring-hydroxylating ferredoxin subunit